MSAPQAGRDKGPVLQVGATGHLGGLILGNLLSRGKRVRALVRPGSDVSKFPKAVEIVRGDLLDPGSLRSAAEDVSAVVTSAIGYSQRREGDSLRTDREGNRNLVDAAKQAGVPRFVLLSILACDQAPDVPHFWAKKEAEDYLAQQNVPFVSLRPGAFLYAPEGGYGQMIRQGIERGEVLGMTPEGIRITYIAPSEVARALAMAVDEPKAVGQKIDLGSDRPLSGPEFAALLGQLLGRPMRVAQTQPSRGGQSDDMMAMYRFFQTGKYVADTRRQAELFGPVPKVEEGARELLAALGLLPGK
ncbi:MAG: SDR family oxidoreductase [Thermoplasmata archaeon]